jgi:hypothetical protein
VREIQFSQITIIVKQTTEPVNPVLLTAKLLIKMLIQIGTGARALKHQHSLCWTHVNLTNQLVLLA